MENSVSSGYVTEKLIQPLLAGSVPIYYGANDVDRVRGSIQHTLSIQPTLKTYPLNTPFNSTYPFNPPSQPTHSTHPLNPPSQLFNPQVLPNITSILPFSFPRLPLPNAPLSDALLSNNDTSSYYETSLRPLVEELQRLMSDDVAYDRYLEWRRHPFSKGFEYLVRHQYHSLPCQVTVG